MTQHDRGMKLRSRDGHFEMADFELKHVEHGYWMWIECKFDGHNGGHWLAPDPAAAATGVTGGVGAVCVLYEPYLWADPVDAFAARDRWEAQQERRG
ncbi:MAG TPA: hypothetical protein VID72_01115 [Ktedonobacterales bacterium]|jgi:hypothetical protein